MVKLWGLRLKNRLKKPYYILANILNRVFVPLENILLNWYSHRFPKKLEARLEQAIDKGLRYFLAQEALEFDPMWLFNKVVNERYEPRLAFARLAYDRYRQEWQDLYIRLFDPEYIPEIHGAHCNKMPWRPGPVQKMMRKVVNFDRLGLGESFLETLLTIEDKGGYGTTHILVGAKVLKQFSDIPHPKLDAVIAGTIDTIVRSQRRERVSDLFSERAMVLQWVGRDDCIEAAWIWRIIMGQMQDGGWYFTKPPFSSTSEQHPSALAITALIMYRESRFRKAAGLK